MRKNKQHHVKGQQKWFHLNGHTVGFLPQIQSDKSVRNTYKTRRNHAESSANDVSFEWSDWSI